MAGQLALFLLHAAAINSRTFSRNCASVQDVCTTALNTWLRKLTGELRCFSPLFDLRLVELPEEPHESGPHTSMPTRHRSAGGIQISWMETSVCHWGIGAGLDYLEQCVPSLGATVLDTLERKGAHAYPLFSPASALDEASYLYWSGEEDENLMLEEECGDDLEARQAMAADMVTRRDIDAAFPPWALDYNRPCLTTREVASIGSGHQCAYVRRAATLTSRLQRTRTTATYCPEQDAPFTGFGAVLCWRDGDLAVRVSDDHANMAWQSAYCDEIGQVTLALDNPSAMRRWMRNVRPNLIAIGLMDSLLWHLSERE